MVPSWFKGEEEEGRLLTAMRYDSPDIGTEDAQANDWRHAWSTLALCLKSDLSVVVHFPNMRIEKSDTSFFVVVVLVVDADRRDTRTVCSPVDTVNSWGSSQRGSTWSLSSGRGSVMSFWRSQWSATQTPSSQTTIAASANRWLSRNTWTQS